MEPFWKERFSPMQLVFLTGRSMLASMVDIGPECMMAMLRYPSSALFLFDFEAAFPSVPHLFLLAALPHLGVPTCMIQGVL